MSEENLSPPSKSILKALGEVAVENDQQRQLTAQGQGLPDESTWGQIGSEAVRKTVMDQNQIVESISEVNPPLAAKLKKCYEDALPLLQNMGAKPEDQTAKLAAAVFLHDYADLRTHISVMTEPSVLSKRGLNIKQQGQLKNWSQAILQNTWGLYQKYAELQNLLNVVGYYLDEDEVLDSLPR